MSKAIEDHVEEHKQKTQNFTEADAECLSDDLIAKVLTKASES